MKQPDERSEAERQREKVVADTLKRAYWDAVSGFVSEGHIAVFNELFYRHSINFHQGILKLKFHVSRCSTVIFSRH
jgi:hypothetical protein